MTEYHRHIEEYLNYWHSGFSKLVPSEEWGNRDLAEKYLQKYWLTEQEYCEKWKSIEDKIFDRDKKFPDLVYHSGFNLILLGGGSLFTEEDYTQLQKAMQEVGEKCFVIVQNSQEYTEGEPMFRMKYPVNTNWDELTSGNYISSVLFEMSYNEYLVFGESGSWGKYSANDYEHPLDIIGYKPERAAIFQDQFKQSVEEWAEVKERLPPQYREIIRE